MKRTKSAALRCSLVIAMASTGAAVVASQSQAALPEHSTVVKRTANEDFLQLVPTGGPRPRIDDFAESGNTVFAGGIFSRVRDLAGEHANQLGLRVRADLPVQAAQRPADRARVVVLHECDVDAGVAVAGSVVALDEEPARVAVDRGIDDQDVRQGLCGGDDHASTRSCSSIRSR